MEWMLLQLVRWTMYKWTTKKEDPMGNTRTAESNDWERLKASIWREREREADARAKERERERKRDLSDLNVHEEVKEVRARKNQEPALRKAKDPLGRLMIAPSSPFRIVGTPASKYDERASLLSLDGGFVCRTYVGHSERDRRRQQQQGMFLGLAVPRQTIIISCTKASRPRRSTAPWDGSEKEKRLPCTSPTSLLEQIGGNSINRKQPWMEENEEGRKRERERARGRGTTEALMLHFLSK